MPVKFKISADGGKSWMDAVSLTENERPFQQVYEADARKLYEWFADFINECRYQIHCNHMEPEEFRIFMPKYLQTFLGRGSDLIYCMNSARTPPTDGFTVFMGISVIEGYENKVIVTHPDYPRINEAYMHFVSELPKL